MTKFFLAVIFLMLILAPNLYSEDKEEIVIKITGFSEKQTPVAINDFVNFDEKGQKLSEEQRIDKVISSDLDLTGWFKLIPKEAYYPKPIDPAKEGYDSGTIDFKKWKALDVSFIIKGWYKVEGSTLKVGCYLFDVVSNKMLLNKQFTGPIDTSRKIAHRCSNLIVEAITGEAGIFETKIACVAKKGKAKEIVIMDFDGKNMQQVTNNGLLNLAPTWSKDGSKLAFITQKGKDWDIYVADMLKKKVTRLTKLGGTVNSPAFSPINDEIAFSMTKNDDIEIFSLGLDGQIKNQLTKSYNIDVSPSWSPDGKKITFTSLRSGRPQIWTMNADGTNPIRLVYEGKNNETPSFSPKGDKISFAGLDTDGEFDIFTVAVAGGTPERLTYDTGNNEYPTWSPDGRFIAFSSTRGSKSKIFIMNKDGKNQRALFIDSKDDKYEEYFSPSWSPRVENLTQIKSPVVQKGETNEK